MQKKLDKRFWAAVLIFGLMGQVAWVVENMYFNVFIYKMFHASAADISAMVMASAVVAAAIIAFAYVRSIFLTIVMDCVMTFFGSTANDAAYNAWLTDRGDSSNRGRIEGVNSMMPLVSILIVFGGFMGFDLDTHSAWKTIYYIIGAATAVIGLMGFFLIEEAPGLKKSEAPFFQTLLYSFRPSTARANKRLYAVLLAFAVFGTSIQIFIEKTLGMANYVLILAPAIVLSAVVTVFYGRAYDRLGFRRSIVPVMGMLAAGYLLLYFFRSTAPVFIGSLLMMAGYLTGMSVFGAQIRDSIPENHSGQFQGVRILGQVFVPGLIGPAIGAAVLKNAAMITNGDGTTSFLPNANIWIAALAVVAVLAVVVAWVEKSTTVKQ